MTGKLSKNFHGVGIGPLSNILAVKYIPSGFEQIELIQSEYLLAFFYGYNRLHFHVSSKAIRIVSR